MELPKSLRFLSLTLCIFLLLLLFITLNSNTTTLQLTRRLRDHAAHVVHHPLDPLTIPELNRVKSILSSHPLFRTARFYALHSVVLEDPPKAAVLRWRVGDPLPPRKASVIARVDGATLVLTVDLETGQVGRVDTGRVTGYPTITKEDSMAAMYAPLASAEFNRSVMSRGVNLADLLCVPLSPGMIYIPVLYILVSCYLFFLLHATFGLIYECI